jgi:uncharacterized membrane protein YfcA
MVLFETQHLRYTVAVNIFKIINMSFAQLAFYIYRVFQGDLPYFGSRFLRLNYIDITKNT